MRDQLGFENRYRPPLEQWAAVGWFTTAAALAVLAFTGSAQLGMVLPLLAAALVAGGARLRQAVELYRVRHRLELRYFDTVTLSMLEQWVKDRPDEVYLGQGFVWEPSHTHRLRQVMALDRAALRTPRWLAAWLDRQNHVAMAGRLVDRDPKGSTRIHGVRDEEHAITLSLSAQSAQNLVIGTTGAGKTMLLNLVAAQAIFRGETCIILDPKKSRAIPELLRVAAQRAGRPFVYFDLGRPEHSDAIDMLADYTRVSQLATRVTAQMATQDNFAGFFWMVLYRLAEGMDYIGDRPTLLTLRRYAEMGSDALLERVMAKRLAAAYPTDLESRLVKFESELPLKGKDSELSRRLRAMLRLYEEEVRSGRDILEINGLIAQVLHNGEHMSKMLASGMPTLTKLTAKPLDELLSPDATNVGSTRKIWTFENIVREGAVVYMGLGALGDAEISSIVGAMALANLCAVAANMYDFPEQYPPSARRPVAVMTDEASELVNPEYIQILNKGREAGVYSWFYIQTIPDLATRLGSRDAAYKMLGNANNRFALRALDPESQKFISDMFGKGDSRSLEHSQNVAMGTEDNLAHYKGGISMKVKTTTAEVIPPGITGELPNLEYFGHIQAGLKVKARFPIVTV